MAKIVVPRMACNVIDRAIQVHGGKGVSQDTPLAYFYTGARSLRIADGRMRFIWRQWLKEALKSKM